MIVVVASCSLLFLCPRTYQEPYFSLLCCDPNPQCMSNALTKTPFSKVSINFYFAPSHTYYQALLILLYNSFVNSCRRGLALQCSSYPRRAWAATGIVVVWFVCLFVCDCCHSTAFTAWIALSYWFCKWQIQLRCRIKAKKLVSQSAYLDVITVRLQHGQPSHAQQASLSNKSQQKLRTQLNLHGLATRGLYSRWCDLQMK